jgi:hypothetical protein
MNQTRVVDGRVELWLPLPPPGGWVCGEPVADEMGYCGVPVESEPCMVHHPVVVERTKNDSTGPGVDGGTNPPVSTAHDPLEGRAGTITPTVRTPLDDPAVIAAVAGRIHDLFAVDRRIVESTLLLANELHVAPWLQQMDELAQGAIRAEARAVRELTIERDAAREELAAVRPAGTVIIGGAPVLPAGCCGAGYRRGAKQYACEMGPGHGGAQHYGQGMTWPAEEAATRPILSAVEPEETP